MFFKIKFALNFVLILQIISVNCFVQQAKDVSKTMSDKAVAVSKDMCEKPKETICDASGEFADKMADKSTEATKCDSDENKDNAACKSNYNGSFISKIIINQNLNGQNRLKDLVCKYD